MERLGALPHRLVEQVLLPVDVGVERALLDADRVREGADRRAVVALLGEETGGLARKLLAAGHGTLPILTIVRLGGVRAGAHDRRGVPRLRRRRRPGRDGRPDARGLPQGADQVHRDARELGAHGRPARARVDPARADAPAEARPHREGAGRGRPRPAHLPRRRGPRQAARGLLRGPDRRQDQVPQRLPLPDEDLGRRRRHRLARRRGGDHLPEGAPQVLLRARTRGS